MKKGDNFLISISNIVLALVAVSLTVLIWNYQKQVDYKLSLLEFKRELNNIRELERNYKYFEAYRSYMNLKELFPHIWSNYTLAKERFEDLPVNRGNHKIIIYSSTSDQNGLANCIRKIKEYESVRDSEYAFWIENSIRADDFCCIVSRFREREKAIEALEYFKRNFNAGSYCVPDTPSTGYRVE